MAIHGITDRPRYFPRVGKIRLGVKDSQRGYPKDTDHFVLTDVPEVAKVYGEKPKKLIIAFPSNDVEQVFPTRLEHWKSRKAKEGDAAQRSILFCSSDGITANRLYVGADRDPQGHAAVQAMPKDDRPDLMDMFQMPCPHEDCPYYEDRSCKRVGRLTFVLPEVSFAGVYQVETSSMYGFGNILDTLSWVKALSQSMWDGRVIEGRLMGAFFELTREPQSMTIPDTGKVTIKHVLNLRVITDLDKIKGLVGRVPPWLVAGNGVKQLQPAQHEVPEELFPEGPTKTVEVEPPVKNDDLELLRAMSGLGKAEFDVLCAKMGGDIDRVRKYVEAQMKKDIDEAIPLATGGISQPATPEGSPVDTKKDVLDGW